MIFPSPTPANFQSIVELLVLLSKQIVLQCSTIDLNAHKNSRKISSRYQIYTSFVNFPVNCCWRETRINDPIDDFFLPTVD